MSNPKAFKNGVQTRFQQRSAIALAKDPIQVRLPADIDAAVRDLPNRSDWLRRVISEAVQRELMQEPSRAKQAQLPDLDPVEPDEPAQSATPRASVKAASVEPAGKKDRYYLQLSYTTGKRKEQWYWDGSELIPKKHRHPSQQAKIYDSRAAALSAAKKLQKHVDQFADRVKQPAALLSLKPVRVTW